MATPSPSLRRRSIPPRHFLTAEQKNALAVHLSEVLEGDRLSRAVFTLDLVCLSALFEGTFAAETKAAVARQHKFFCKMVTDGRALQASLQQCPPFVREPLDWIAFDRALDSIIKAADCEAQASRPQCGGGRPPLRWRDKLIMYVYKVYPAKTATKSVGSHFERTVEMLLGFLARDVEDIHGVVVDALRRRPAASLLARITPR
jgi:hypothetical protein